MLVVKLAKSRGVCMGCECWHAHVCALCMAACQGLGTWHCAGDEKEDLSSTGRALGFCPGSWHGQHSESGVHDQDCIVLLLARHNSAHGVEIQGWGSSSLACLWTEPGRGCASPATTIRSLLPLPQDLACPCALQAARGAGQGPLPRLAAARAMKQRKAVGAALTMVPMLYVAAGPMVWWYGSAAAYTLP